MNGAERIAAERQRQIEAEGWDPEHDKSHRRQQLALAAVCYAMPAGLREMPIWKSSLWHKLWPWDSGWWKPTPGNRIRELEKAGALIAAEIDRLIAGGE